ncbi:MAG: DNA replication/repair protein RecF [Faecalibacterium sp.]|nr:DNA replication/repair protein RecF [Faecalibacterium sp.]
MRLLSLSVQNYRNIETVALTPGRELTVICGHNGQGKTNLLEAVWLLTGGKSFRGGKDAELVRRGQPFAILEGVVEAADGRQDTLRIAIGSPESERPGRTAKRNGVDKGRAANLAGLFTAVVFDPGHLSLVKGAPEGRRKFLDAALCQLYPGYLTVYRRYVRTLTQKNALLRKYYENGPAAADILDALNAQLAATGEEIQRRRLDYLALLGPIAQANYAEISKGAEALTVAYAPLFEPGGLAEALRQHKTEEIRAGCSLMGPHREDMTLLLDGEPAKVFASQGQQRSVVLSLKLAEAAAAAQITGEHPVMLLDDVLSELDENRRRYLLTRMKEKQTFVTSCDDTAFLQTDGLIYTMAGGVLGGPVQPGQGKTEPEE